jgi:hypothetical protein
VTGSKTVEHRRRVARVVTTYFLRGDAPELARPLSRRPPLPSRDIDNPA